MKHYVVILSSLLFFAISNGEDRIEFFRLGINGATGLTSITDLNSIADTWLKARDDSSSSEMMQVSHEGAEMPINYEYGFQPFITITLWNLWQIGLKYDYLQSPHIYNSLFKDTIKVQIDAHVPSLFTGLHLGSFEIGGGILYAVSTVNWDDNFFGYSSKWAASGWGYEFKIGAAPRFGGYVGMNISAGYRGLILKSVCDNAGREIFFTDTGKPLKLNMSGLVINLGLYFCYTQKKGGSK